MYKLDDVLDVIDFFNKLILLSSRYNTTLLLTQSDFEKEPVKQLRIKYASIVNIVEVSDDFYEKISK